MMMQLKFLDMRYAQGVCALLAALCVFTFLDTLWQWHSDWVLAHQVVVPSKTLASTDQMAALIAAIPNEHLFGESLSKNNMPITNLQLLVTGIVKTTSDQQETTSKAYISMSGQPSHIYQVGDVLPSGVKIYAITPNAVILQIDGHLEKLPLPRERLQFKPRNKEEHW